MWRFMTFCLIVVLLVPRQKFLDFPLKWDPVNIHVLMYPATLWIYMNPATIALPPAQECTEKQLSHSLKENYMSENNGSQNALSRYVVVWQDFNMKIKGFHESSQQLLYCFTALLLTSQHENVITNILLNRTQWPKNIIYLFQFNLH